ncbi:hypothetical protein Sa4125_34420 [Aureimonas sp. SA4125]|uniref:hypothetical protein n=1 Tax=Aureimonas sp. SA4125 TaxID=2826993 RepID=UPI001CC6DEAF|nr:hypothetical protein [Aureimonas sp. SA4125]BDA85900.1 hypothetical protein Sa4125_34420 [Aureimonas sp. SA4125]
MTIASTYQDGGIPFKRELHYSEPQKQIEEDDFSIVPGDIADIGTIIQLYGFKEAVRLRISHGNSLSSLFSASILKRQMLVAFLQRLVGLGEQLDDFESNYPPPCHGPNSLNPWTDGSR